MANWLFPPGMEVFPVNAKVRQRLRNCKRRIRRRLRQRQWQEQRRRMFRDRNIHYEIGDRARGLHAGGLGACQLLEARKRGHRTFTSQRSVKVRYPFSFPGRKIGPMLVCRILKRALAGQKTGGG